jgi:hypothetical protein
MYVAAPRKLLRTKIIDNEMNYKYKVGGFEFQVSS